MPARDEHDARPMIAAARTTPTELAERGANHLDRANTAARELHRRHRAAGDLLGDAVGLSLERAAENAVEHFSEAVDNYSRALGMTTALAEDERIRLTREIDQLVSLKLRALFHLRQVTDDELDRRTRQARPYRREPSFRDKAGKRLREARRFLDEEAF
jgi:hypothetical protein